MEKRFISAVFLVIGMTIAIISPVFAAMHSNQWQDENIHRQYFQAEPNIACNQDPMDICIVNNTDDMVLYSIPQFGDGFHFQWLLGNQGVKIFGDKSVGSVTVKVFNQSNRLLYYRTDVPNHFVVSIESGLNNPQQLSFNVHQ